MDILAYIIQTLDTVEVRGSENMSKLLGCIAALKELQQKPRESPGDQPTESGE